MEGLVVNMELYEEKQLWKCATLMLVVLFLFHMYHDFTYGDEVNQYIKYLDGRNKELRNDTYRLITEKYNLEMKQAFIEFNAKSSKASCDFLVNSIYKCNKANLTYKQIDLNVGVCYNSSQIADVGIRHLWYS